MSTNNTNPASNPQQTAAQQYQQGQQGAQAKQQQPNSGGVVNSFTNAISKVSDPRMHPEQGSFSGGLGGNPFGGG
jgi:hypothetical protein